MPQGFAGLVALGEGSAEIFSEESLTLWLSGKWQVRVLRQGDDNLPLGELARIYVRLKASDLEGNAAAHCEDR